MNLGRKITQLSNCEKKPVNKIDWKCGILMNGTFLTIFF